VVSNNADEADIEESWRSVMLPILQEMLEEMGLGVGQNVILTSEGEGMRVEPLAPRPSPDATEFMALFTKKYKEATRNLAHR
jgi:hypothetical protein